MFFKTVPQKGLLQLCCTGLKMLVGILKKLVGIMIGPVGILKNACRYFETVGIMNVGIMKVGILETLLRGVREQMMRGKHSKRVHIEYIHSSIVIR